jgi:NAD(P)-dependent dehydrogenase (short-subunit alcohol dehydrogenase family)
MGELSGKVAIVTGGGRGIGRAYALALASEGASVLVNDLGGDLSGDGEENSAPADEVVATITEAGGRAAANNTDISDWDACVRIAEAALQKFGRIDIVINNAGIARFGPIDVISRQDWERTIAVNVTGAAALTHWVAAHWREAGPEAGRKIVNTTSGAGLTPAPNNPMYATSKAGLAALTITSALELADLGVRVNGIAPIARSRISEVVMGDATRPPEDGFDRWAAENVAAVGTYLASPRCRFTGRIFGIAGDDLTVYDGWTVGFHANNGEQRWTFDFLDAALAKVPLQQRRVSQAVNGLQHDLVPWDPALESLKAVEGA